MHAQRDSNSREKPTHERRGPSAGPLPSRPALAMRLRLDAASIAVPAGDRPVRPAFSGAGLGEGLHVLTAQSETPPADSAEKLTTKAFALGFHCRDSTPA